MQVGTGQVLALVGTPDGVADTFKLLMTIAATNATPLSAHTVVVEPGLAGSPSVSRTPPTAAAATPADLQRQRLELLLGEHLAHS